MKLSEFLDRITPEDEGGTSRPPSMWVEFSNGVRVGTREDSWDTYEIDHEAGEWTDGAGMIRRLLELGCIPDVELEVGLRGGR